MSEIRLEAIKERLYMQREMRRIIGFHKRIGHNMKQGRLDFLHKHLQYSYWIWS